MNEATDPAGGLARRPRAPATSMYGLIALAIMAVGGQLWGLRSLVQFSGERERWNNAKARDEAQSAERVRLITELEAALSKGRIAARQAQAESEVTKKELARQSSALADVDKQLELARVARSDLDEQIGEARRRLRQAAEARQETETKVAELAVQRDKLAREVEQLSKRRDQQEPAVKDVDAELKKSQALLKTVRGQVDDFEARLSASQAKLGESRQAIVKASGELEGILKERAEAAAERDTAQVELVSLKKQAEQVGVDRKAALDEVAKLRDTLRQLADQTKSSQDAKEVAEAESGRVNSELARLQKSIGAKDTELKAVQDRLAESEKRRTAVLAEIEQLRGTLEPLQAQVAQARAELSARRLELQGSQTPPDAPPVPGSPSAPSGTATAYRAAATRSRPRAGDRAAGNTPNCHAGRRNRRPFLERPRRAIPGRRVRDHDRDPRPLSGGDRLDGGFLRAQPLAPFCTTAAAAAECDVLADNYPAACRLENLRELVGEVGEELGGLEGRIGGKPGTQSSRRSRRHAG